MSTNDNIAAGMQALIARANHRTPEQRMLDTPEEREAADARREQLDADMEIAMRDAAIMQRLNTGYSRIWWVWRALAVAHAADTFTSNGMDLDALRRVYDASDVYERIVGHDPTLFGMFKEMAPEARGRYMRRILGAPLPPTEHPLQLADPVTGEFKAREAA